MQFVTNHFTLYMALFSNRPHFGCGPKKEALLEIIFISKAKFSNVIQPLSQTQTTIVHSLQLNSTLLNWINEHWRDLKQMKSGDYIVSNHLCPFLPIIDNNCLSRPCLVFSSSLRLVPLLSFSLCLPVCLSGWLPTGSGASSEWSWNSSIFPSFNSIQARQNYSWSGLTLCKLNCFSCL